MPDILLNTEVWVSPSLVCFRLRAFALQKEHMFFNARGGFSPCAPTWDLKRYSECWIIRQTGIRSDWHGQR